MTITALPTPPSRSDPVNFAARGDALFGALPTLVTEMNAATAEVDVDRAAAAASASAALASQNAAATSAGNASSSAASSTSAAVSALSAAAAAQAGLPAQTQTNGQVLRSVQGLAAWGHMLNPTTVVYSGATTRNQIANSSALNCPSWSLGPNASAIDFDQVVPGPNGLRSVYVTHAAVGNAYVDFTHTPVQGVTKTASVWWQGTVRPATGQLLAADYRDASNVLQRAVLNFSDASVIADGQWRRYSLTWTHAGSNVTACKVFVVVDAGVGNHRFADPQIEAASVATEYAATGPLHLAEPDCCYDFDTASGAATLFLPANATAIPGACVGIKDAGRVASTNNITINRNGTAIEGATNDIEFDVNGASIVLQFVQWRGWLIK